MKERLLNIELESFLYNNIIKLKNNREFIYDFYDDELSIYNKITGKIERFNYLYKEQVAMDYKLLMNILFSLSK